MPPLINNPSEVYARQLAKIGRGLPLFEPEPTESGEIQVGDVGYLKGGGFYRIFNTIEPEPDGVDLPDDFEFFELKDGKTAIQTRVGAMVADFHCGRSIRKTEIHGSLSTFVLVCVDILASRFLTH